MECRGTAESVTLQLDSHVVVWLYAGEHHRFSHSLREQLGRGRLRFSPMVRLELAYLYETGKITDSPASIIDELSTAVGLKADSEAFGRVITVAERLDFSLDPFDRIIVAQAVAADARLVTKDERVHAAHPDTAYWP